MEHNNGTFVEPFTNTTILPHSKPMAQKLEISSEELTEEAIEPVDSKISNPDSNLTINLADEQQSSEETSHELLLKTSSKIKESFVITSENNIIFIKEKLFDPAHLKKHHSNHNVTGLDLSSSDSTINFSNAQVINYSKNRNVRHTPQEQQKSRLSYNPSKRNVFSELKRLNEKQLQLEAIGNLTKRPPLSTMGFPYAALADSARSSEPNYAYKFQMGIFCSFEVKCDWTWKNNSGFRVVNAEQMRALRFGPRIDADNRTIGKSNIFF